MGWLMYEVRVMESNGRGLSNLFVAEYRGFRAGFVYFISDLITVFIK